MLDVRKRVAQLKGELGAVEPASVLKKFTVLLEQLAKYRKAVEEPMKKQ